MRDMVEKAAGRGRMEMNMKIGIVTVHDSANYGSFLQGYALYHILESWGHEVYFIRSREKEFVKQIFCPKISKKKLLKHPLKSWKAHCQGKEKYVNFQKELEEFRVLEHWNDVKLDKIILGSDEIWNVKTPTFRREIFYGIGMENVTTYAVSAGAATLKQLQEYPVLVEGIKKIDNILVRDINTQKIVEQITGISPRRVCDPTFLLPVSAYVSADPTAIMEQNQKYILIYSYHIQEHLKNNIIKFAKENNLKMVAACMNHDWCDEFVNGSPLKFCEILRDAEYVVTTTFHGTIFSFLNHKKFVAEPFSPKVNDVLEKVGLEEALIEENISYEAFKQALQNGNYDYTSVEEKISDWRERSLKLLKDSLA